MVHLIGSGACLDKPRRQHVSAVDDTRIGQCDLRYRRKTPLGLGLHAGAGSEAKSVAVPREMPTTDRRPPRRGSVWVWPALRWWRTSSGSGKASASSRGIACVRRHPHNPDLGHKYCDLIGRRDMPRNSRTRRWGKPRNVVPFAIVRKLPAGRPMITPDPRAGDADHPPPPCATRTRATYRPAPRRVFATKQASDRGCLAREPEW